MVNIFIHDFFCAGRKGACALSDIGEGGRTLAGTITFLLLLALI